jgi:glycosyltransferase involved in cell wall biosynthesis
MSSPAPQLPFGVNVAGYLTGESGLGGAARGYIEVLQQLGVPLSLTNFTRTSSRQGDRTHQNFTSDAPYAINLICINPDQLPYFLSSVNPHFLKDHYNIGVWAWEQPSFPEQWHHFFEPFQEVWVYSHYIADALAPVSPIPILRVPVPIQVAAGSAQFSRADFGLPEDEFSFLFIFDFQSVFVRKNPLAVAEAFRRTFRPDEPVRLVLKFINSDQDPENYQRLQSLVGERRVTLLEGYFSGDRTKGLMAVCDCYVSLHRAEGFGMTLAESMALGKPVIGTGWSGNLDFMSVANSALVDYRLEPLQEQVGAYQAGQLWATASVEDAARWMRRLYDDRDLAQKLGQRAAADIAQTLGVAAIGRIVNPRLNLALRGSQIRRQPASGSAVCALPPADLMRGNWVKIETVRPRLKRLHTWLRQQLRNFILGDLLIQLPDVTRAQSGFDLQVIDEMNRVNQQLVQQQLQLDSQKIALNRLQQQQRDQLSEPEVQPLAPSQDP